MSGIKTLADRKSDLFHVNPDKLVIITDPGHPLYDKRVLLPINPSDVACVIKYGVKENVIVRKDGDAFQVCEGRQRVRWAREANKLLAAAGKSPITVPCTVSQVSDVDAGMLGVALNEHRQQDTPMLKAHKAKRLIDQGVPIAEVAQEFRLTVNGMQGLLALLDTDDVVQKAVEEGRIAPTAAAKLAALPREEQRKAMVDMEAAGSVTNRAVVEHVKQARAAKSNAGPDAAVMPPSGKERREVLAAYQKDPATVDAAALLGWVCTGKGASKIVGPGGTATLAAWLRAARA